MMAFQVDRILLALRSGPVSPIDFAAPNVIDGGLPVMRVAARVQDLRDRGYEISTMTAANGTAVYTLTGDVDLGDAATAAEPVSSSAASPTAVAQVSAPTHDSGGAPSPPESALFDTTEFAPRDAYKDAA